MRPQADSLFCSVLKGLGGGCLFSLLLQRASGAVVTGAATEG